MSWKIIRICDRCGDAKMTDYIPDEAKLIGFKGKEIVLCEECKAKLKELNQKLDNYVTESRKNFLKGE